MENFDETKLNGQAKKICSYFDGFINGGDRVLAWCVRKQAYCNSNCPVGIKAWRDIQDLVKLADIVKERRRGDASQLLILLDKYPVMEQALRANKSRAEIVDIAQSIGSCTDTIFHLDKDS